MRKRNLLLSAVGIGAGLLYLFTRQGRDATTETQKINEAEDVDGNSGKSSAQRRATSQDPAQVSGNGHEVDNIIIDDQGTDQSEASHILKHIRDVAFDADDEKLALALGRPAEEIEEWTKGSGVIDGDVIMKARGLALSRGIEIE
jgi:hypothetical protein